MKRARGFEKLVSQWNVKASIRLITEQAGSGSLSLSSIQPDGRTVKDHLLAKHPPGVPASSHSISDEPHVSEPHPIIFEQIDGPFVRSTVLQMNGFAGPSGLDARAWKHLCTSIHSASADLCASIAHLTSRLCTSYVHPRGISALTACGQFALDKCPGMRPIGVGETLRCLISKATLRVTRYIIQKVVGNLQLCAGQAAACEASIHAMRGLLESEGTEAIIMVDASNAFKSLNREAALRNVRIVCLLLLQYLSTLTANHLGYSLIMSTSGLRRVPRRVTPWPWLCTALAHFH